MPMVAKGLAKLTEECGEVVERAGQALPALLAAKPHSGFSPELVDEMADLMAAILFVAEKSDLDCALEIKRLHAADDAAALRGHEGLPALITACGQLQQVAGKKMARPGSDEHWDGKGSLNGRLNEAMTAVLRAIGSVTCNDALYKERMSQRASEKLARFRSWDTEPIA